MPTYLTRAALLCVLTGCSTSTLSLSFSEAPPSDPGYESGVGSGVSEEREMSGPWAPMPAEPIEQQPSDPEAEPRTPAYHLVDTDYCDDEPLSDQSWIEHVEGDLAIQVLPNTAALEQLAEIVAARQQAYDAIRERLGVAARPTITAVLSPSRTAALAHDLGMGTAYAGADRYEAVYSGSADGYEARHYGHELTHLLAYYTEPGGRDHLSFLDEGVAELLDQSGRDMHAAYAEQLIAGLESRAHLTTFDGWDVGGGNYGRAGSFVQLLIERHGWQAFLSAWSAAVVDWSSGCQRHAEYGCIDTPEDLAIVLDFILEGALGDSLAALQAAWLLELEPRLAAAPAEIGGADRAEIENLLMLMDRAAQSEDAAAYRSTMDGFYCDWLDESGRQELAARAVGAYDEVTSQLLVAYPTHTENFTAAYALVLRQEKSGAVSFAGLYLEKFPIGWRVTWGPDWY